MKFTKVANDTFRNIQSNAGIMLSDFDPTAGTFDAEDLLGATTGGIQVNITQNFSDYGEDIDNVPNNTKELKRKDDEQAVVSGTYVAMTITTAQTLVAGSDVAGIKITPRRDLKLTDFKDIWFVGDFSDINTGTNAGFLAVHLIDCLSTGGFQLQTADKGKGNFAFEYTAHYSLDAQDTVPYEIYLKQGSE